jgi:hypothetical protein
MALSAVAALLVMLLAYAGQSPQMVYRLGRMGHALRQRARLLIGTGVACLMLALGFFMAGVPLDGGAAGEPMAAEGTPTNPFNTPLASTALTIPAIANADEGDSGESGSFGTQDGAEGEVEMNEGDVMPALTAVAGEEELTEEVSGGFGESRMTMTADALLAAVTPVGTPSATPTPSPTSTASPTPTPSNTPTPTPSPTLTPTPTFTPTPMSGPTAVVRAQGRALWVRRSPNGQRLVPLAEGEMVSLTGGRANFDGALWQEIRTGAGVLGWLEDSYLEPTP